MAKGRRALLGRAGAVWTPTYAFPARPPLKVLVLPGAEGVERWGRDPLYLDFLGEVWEELEAVFPGENAHLFLAEAGRLPPKVAAQGAVAQALEPRGSKIVDAPWHWEGRVCSTWGVRIFGTPFGVGGENLMEGKV